MSASQKVISVGSDAELLWLRDAVLRNAGFDVLTILDPKEAVAKNSRRWILRLTVIGALRRGTEYRIINCLAARREMLMNSGQPKFNKEELLAFAKSYLSEAFPNPNRIGCPPVSELACMAEFRRDGDPSIREHLSRCSPCFKEYMEILSHVRRRHDTGLGRSS